MSKQVAKWYLALFLVMAMFAYAMFQGGFVSWFLFYSVMPLMLYAFAIAIFPLKTIQIERTLYLQSYVAEQPLQVMIDVKKPFFPLFYLVVREQLPEAMETKSGAKAIFFPFFKRTLTFTYEIPRLPRGEHRFASIILKTGDPFGFVQKQLFISTEEQSIVVYPRIEKLDWQPKHSQQAGDSGPLRASNTAATTVSGVRDYVPGDRLSWLDWKAIAKRNQLLTKQFEQPKNQDVMLFLDCSKASYQEKGKHLFEVAVSLAASVVAVVYSSKGAVTLANSDLHKPRAAVAREQWLYYALAKVEANERQSFAEKVADCLPRLSSTHSFIFITAKLSQELIGQMRKLAFHNKQVECFYVKEKSQNDVDLVAQLQKSGVMVHKKEVGSQHFINW